MVTLKVKASVQSTGDKHFLEIVLDSETVRLPISDDSPNQVKSAFNRLIERTRSGAFVIELDRAEDDLFSQVAKEYIVQLNKEIREVREEMKQFKLLGEDSP
jgi:hypothetical protein